MYQLVLFSLVGLLLATGCEEDRRSGDAGADSGDAGADSGDAGTDSGSGGGLDSSRLLTSLDMEERRAFCAEFSGALGTMTRTCDGGLAFTPQPVDECAVDTPPASCTATIGQTRDCIEALGGDVCGLFTTPECSFIASCASVSAD